MDTVSRLLRIVPKNSLWKSPIPDLFLWRADAFQQVDHYVQEPSICVILQGERCVQVLRHTYQFSPQHLMFCPVRLPVQMKIHADEKQPFLGLSLRIDLALVNELLLEHPDIVRRSRTPLEFGEWGLEKKLEIVVKRFLLLLETPEDIDALAPLMKKEIYYRLLISPQGERLKQMAQMDSHTYKIACATDWIKHHLNEHMDIHALAHECGMSLSGFHHHFKKVTTMSPLQYQKSLRLTEARRLIQTHKYSVTQAAFGVGYESTSQFSREYSRYFGCTPTEDLKG
ncbi:MAG: AraC family transcriptional regulator [Acinetobacter sp.]|nr:AraC family transcriptional regulator [Acinetobacter sp.]